MRNTIIASAILVALLLPTSPRAGGYFLTNVNPRDLAMVDSAVAAQDSAAAVIRNPAALARLNGFNLSLADALLDLHYSWAGNTAPFVGQSSSTYPKAAYPPALAVSYSDSIADHRFGIGAGMSIVGGGYNFWPADWPGRFQIQTIDRKVYAFNFAGAYEVIPQIRVGAGLVYYRTTEDLEERINYLVHEDTAHLGTSGDALSYDLSAEIVPLASIPFVIGVDYKHQGVQTLTGKAHLGNPPPALAPFALDQAVSHVLTIPNRLFLGASGRPVPRLLLTFTWSFDRWVVYPQDAFIGNLGTTLVIPRNYMNGNTLRFGAEYDLLPALKVRAGVLRDFSPNHPGVVDPALPDANSWAFGFGLSYLVIRDVAVHATFFYDDRDEITGVPPSRFPGIYNSHAAIYSLGVTWHFGKEQHPNPGMMPTL